MRRIVTGVDADGRSCVVEEGEVSPRSFEGIIGVRSGALWTTDEHPLPASPRQAGHANDVQLAPGILRWMVVEHDPPVDGKLPEVCVELHHQDALELVFIMSGSTRLVLDEDERELAAGDCVVLPGNDHAFETGPAGCQMLVVAIGTLPAG
jgi:mannose-6-phosphate isomerase-like protein (cupin superfamily)